MSEIVHACPERDSAVTGCCGRKPFDLPRSDRMTVRPEEVTCSVGATLINLVRVLSVTYDDVGVAIWLTSYHRRLRAFPHNMIRDGRIQEVYEAALSIEGLA